MVYSNRLTISFLIFSEFQKPLFKTGITTIESLVVGQILSGRVSNVTHFGAFVDVGVGRDGLLHNSQMFVQNKRVSLKLHDKIEVSVQSVELNSKRIGLCLVSQN